MCNVVVLLVRCLPAIVSVALRLAYSLFMFAPLSRRPRGLMDKASVFGTEDCRFESYRGHRFIFLQCVYGQSLPSSEARSKLNIRTPGIEPGTIRYLLRLQSNALPTELCSVRFASVLLGLSVLCVSDRNGVRRRCSRGWRCASIGSGTQHKTKSHHWGSNPGPSAYKADALPLSYNGARYFLIAIPIGRRYTELRLFL